MARIPRQVSCSVHPVLLAALVASAAGTAFSRTAGAGRSRAADAALVRQGGGGLRGGPAARERPHRRHGVRGAGVGPVPAERLHAVDGRPSRPGRQPRCRQLAAQVREALFKGDYKAADALTRKMQGKFSQSYAPLGDLYIDAPGLEPPVRSRISPRTRSRDRRRAHGVRGWRRRASPARRSCRTRTSCSSSGCRPRRPAAWPSRFGSPASSGTRWRSPRTAISCSPAAPLCTPNRTTGGTSRTRSSMTRGRTQRARDSRRARGC